MNWLFELKRDGCRTLAHVEGNGWRIGVGGGAVFST
jgi:ATP-dependent DNA ligase